MIQKLKLIFSSLMRGMNHDFCPDVNRYVYWLKKPIGWVVCGTLFSLLVGLFVGPQGFVLMWSLVALLALGVAWPWVSMKGLTCKLYFDESRAQENKEVKVTLEITNRLPLPAFGLMLTGQFLQEGYSDDDLVAVALKRVAPWSVSRFDWKVTPSRRGQLPTQVPTLSTGFPFGLYHTETTVVVNGKTIVWPACHPLDGVPPLDGSQFNVDGTASQRAGNDGETIGVREYRQGDSIRNIHWNHTARCNRLIVREKQTLTQTPIRIVVDLTENRHSGEGGQGTYEWAIRVAATVCKQLHQHQAKIELVCLGLPANIPDQINNRAGLQPVLDFLALLPQYMPSLRTSIPGEISHQPIVVGDQFTILIHTKSFPDGPNSKQLKKICINSSGFKANEVDDLLLSNENEIGRVDIAASEITSPHLAAEQLGQLWRGDFHAVS